MADVPNPPSVKRGLPFKRTARQKPASAESATDDDGLALFSQSKTFFPTVIEDQKRAREKAEQERQEKLAQAKEEEERKARAEEKKREADEAILIREQMEEAGEFLRKRPRDPLRLDSDDENGDKDDVSVDRPRKLLKASIPLSPESRSHASQPRSPHGPGSARLSRTFVKAESPVVLIDSSDDEVVMKNESRSPTTSPRQSGGSQLNPPYVNHPGQDKVRADDDDNNNNNSDSDVEMAGTNVEDELKENDPLQPYVKAAIERARREKEAQLAREAAGGDGNSKGKATGMDDRAATVSIMIAAPSLPDAKALCCTVRTSQALQIAFDTFKERQKVHTKYPHKLISALVFTWRGDRVYNSTKLETLGILPRDREGRLYHKTSSRSAPEGYLGKDKVFFEACTPEEYEEDQQKRERERKRQEMGEWWSEDDEGMDDAYGGDQDKPVAEEPAEADDDRVKVIFKARDMPQRNVTLRKSSTVTQMIKAFRRLTGLGEDKHIEIRWDGEVLDAETTVEEAEIGDLDSVEVHVR